MRRLRFLLVFLCPIAYAADQPSLSGRPLADGENRLITAPAKCVCTSTQIYDTSPLTQGTLLGTIANCQCGNVNCFVFGETGRDSKNIQCLK